MRSAPATISQRHDTQTLSAPAGSRARFAPWHSATLQRLSAVPFGREIGAGEDRLSRDRPCPGGGLASTALWREYGASLRRHPSWQGPKYVRTSWMYAVLPSCCCMGEVVTSVWVSCCAFALAASRELLTGFTRQLLTGLTRQLLTGLTRQLLTGLTTHLLTGLTMPGAAARRRAGPITSSVGGGG